MAAVEGKKLKTPGVKKICDDWKFCYYCKPSHPGQKAINCPNKCKQSQLNAIEMGEETKDVVSEKAWFLRKVACRDTPLICQIQYISLIY